MNSKMANTKGLVDSGATDCFMSPQYAKQLGIGTRPLQRPRKIWNIDNTENKDGLITHYTDLTVQTGNRTQTIRFLIMNIRNKGILLGYPWLAAFEPKFDWKSATINEKALPMVI